MTRQPPLSELIRIIRYALENLPGETLAQAANDAETAHRTVSESLTGTNNPHALEALGSSIRGQHHLEAARVYMELFRTNLGAYLYDVAGTGTGTPFAPPTGQFPEPMPQWVRKPGATNKTHGRWVDREQRTHILMSGRHDSAFNKAKEKAWQLGIVEPPTILDAAADVELKFAVEMNPGQHASIVINNPSGPCPPRYGCNKLLPYFLPEGASLTVCWPGGRKTYKAHEEKPNHER